MSGQTAHTTHVVYVATSVDDSDYVIDFPDGKDVGDNYIMDSDENEVDLGIVDTGEDYNVNYDEFAGLGELHGRDPYMVHFTDEEKGGEGGQGFLAITDCACSRTLAGKTWMASFLRHLKAEHIPFFVLPQEEIFKFGGKKLYPSKMAVVTWLSIKNKWFLVKISVVSADVPLLLSRVALAELGMNYNIAKGLADFASLGVSQVSLIMSSSGHPQVSVTGTKPDLLTWPERVDWSLTEIFVPQLQEVYMVSPQPQSHLFYPKKLTKAVHDMLIAEPLHHEAFLNWWRSKDHYRDFWIEIPEYMYRIHVTPRSKNIL